VRRAFDVSATAQAAALASLDDPEEIAARRQLNAEGLARLAEILRGHGLDPAGPARGNFLFADVAGGRDLFERLLREGVIVRPLDGFGAPRRSGSPSARRRKTSSSLSLWATSFRASRNQLAQVVASRGLS
jgi:histidinol-phosphate/aromatic aminotransferase/cobyric acid decarboxylase-like protein